MSHQLISRNPTLQKLQDEGYEIEIRSNYLLIHSVPYVTAQRKVGRGILISELTLAAPEVVDKPGTHQIYFMGEHPCNPDGTELTQIKNSSPDQHLADGLIGNHYFSNKPQRGFYESYHEKVTSYVRVIGNQARAIDPTVTAKTYKVVESNDEASVFLYQDTASSRAGIQKISDRVKNHKVAIVGLGGTGAYVLDLVSKTHVLEIHLYDADKFRQHNAFRTPGAAPRAVLDRQLSKVAYLTEIYSGMRRGVIPHEVMISEANVSELAQYDFVFICVDKGSVRRLIAEAFRTFATCFIDVGMGVNMTDDERLWGTCRVTTSTPATREIAESQIPSADREDELYGSNIQIADFNCINAALAVMRWKRLCGIYLLDRDEYDATFNVNLNQLSNKEPKS